jgi:choline-sulfatase
MSADRPNVLLILCDQQRHDWLGYRGADWLRTPNLDALAERSMVFTQAICTSPVCAPARIGLASGIRPHRLGSLHNHSFLPLSRQTYYAQLRDRGFHVGCCGKLDLAKPDGYNGLAGDRPWAYAWGFTRPHECEGKMHAGRGNPPNGPYTHWLREQDPKMHEAFCADYRNRAGGAVKVLAPSVVPAELFEDVYIGQTSCRMIRELPDDFPWHFFVSFVGPHNPFDPPAEYYEHFRDAEMPAAVPYEPEGKPPLYRQDPQRLADEEQIRLARRLYAGYIECIDEQIGRILQTVEDRGQADNTYVLFAADHGEMLGDHGRWTKSCQYEASLRVPMLAAGPDIQPGQSDALVELSDLNPTICELAGVEPVAEIDARSFVNVLGGRTESHRQWTMATHYRTGCVRTRQYKAIINESGLHELYDLQADPDERSNIIQAQPDVFEQMARTYWTEWAGGPNY